MHGSLGIKDVVIDFLKCGVQLKKNDDNTDEMAKKVN